MLMEVRMIRLWKCVLTSGCCRSSFVGEFFFGGFVERKFPKPQMGH